MSEVTRIDIEVEYFTHSKDQAVYIQLSSKRKLRSTLLEPIKMKSEDGQHWSQTIELPSSKVEDIDYGFTVRTRRKFIDEEKGRGRFAHQLMFKAGSHIKVKSLWHSDMGKNYMYSSAYTDTINSYTPGKEVFDALSKHDIALAFTDYIPIDDCQVCLCGDSPATGNWVPAKAVKSLHVGSATWAFPLNFADVPEQGLNYKFILVNQKTGAVVWEEGENRFLAKPAETNYKLVVDLNAPKLPQNDLKVAGVVVPVFSLRSDTSWGIGDFGDLRKMIDWAASAGLHAVQLLPVNDTTREGNWHDSYPYNPISTFALHPIYMDFESLTPIKSKTKLKLYLQRRQAVNALPQLDYDEVFDLKENYLHDFFEENKVDILRSARYKDFKRDNADWLVPYSFFRYLLKVHGTANFRKWPKFREYDQVALQRWAIASNILDEIEFYGVVQYLLDRQLKDVHDYARSKGVILKGDIPIGVSRDSATAWVYPKYLNSDSQAGAPPDFFSAKGQNWGFPTYNWEAILADDGIWWKQRLVHMARYFDAYRIDHVLGFFRIWEIPLQHYYGTLGHFNPALPLTPQELKIMGFTDNPELYTVPRFTEGEMQRHFGELLPVAKEYFFEFDELGKWALIDKYAKSQRLIDRTLKDMGFNGHQRELFLSAYTNVLFIHDGNDKRKFHLNVWAKNTRAYKHLAPHNLTAYDRIYQYFFYDRHNTFWTQEAYQRLPKLTCATSMLTCAEDLGMIPACVHPVLKDLNILTLEIETMPKLEGMQFADLKTNPLYSVDTISTHDMAPLRLWWKQNPDAASDYWHNVLHMSGTAPQTLSPEQSEMIVRHHMESKSLLCIISLQDWLAMSPELRSDNLEQEQINHPEIPRHYWRWRMLPTIEQLQADLTFTDKVREIAQLRKN